MLQALFIFAFCLSSTQAFYCGPGSSDCEPNCDDGVSVCDLSYQNCLNDGFGGCFDVPTVTFIASLVPYPVTSYVASEYFTVTTGYPTQIVPLDSEIPEYVDATSYAYQTETITQTVTVDGPVVTETVTDSAIAERRGLKARQGPTALTAIITVTGPAPITFETADFEVDVAAPTVYLTSYAYYTDTITDYVAATNVETTTVYETVTADPSTTTVTVSATPVPSSTIAAPTSVVVVASTSKASSSSLEPIPSSSSNTHNSPSGTSSTSSATVQSTAGPRLSIVTQTKTAAQQSAAQQRPSTPTSQEPAAATAQQTGTACRSSDIKGLWRWRTLSMLFALWAARAAL